VQVLVAGEPTTALFSIVDVGSPEPNFKSVIKAKGPNGKVKLVEKFFLYF